MGLCIITKTEYERRMQKEIDKTADAYQLLNLSIGELHRRRSKMFADLKEFIKSHLNKQYGRASIIKYILKPTEKTFKICELKGLAKIHKPGDRMRIIFPLAGHPLSYLHKFIARCLEPAVIKKESVITNVMEIIDWLQNNELPAGTKFCTADINSMYPNVDREEAIKIATTELASMSPAFGSFNPLIFWKRIMKDAHQNIEFKFKDQLFNQIKGVPIGSPAGPQIAMIYLHSKIALKWQQLKEEMFFGGIYFDDAFLIFKPSISTEQIHQRLNGLLEDTTLNFDPDSFTIKTVEQMTTESFDILDISISSTGNTTDNYKCYTKMYAKPVGGSQYLHYCSAHPPACKRSIIKGELSRRLRLTDKLEDWIATKQELWQKLRRRQYPIKVLAAEFAKVCFNDRIDSRRNLIQKLKTRRQEMKFPITNEIVNPTKEPEIAVVQRYEPSTLRMAKRRRSTLEDQLNLLFRENRLRIKRVKLINAFKVTNKLEKIMNKKDQSVTSTIIATTGSPSSSSNLEIAPVGEIVNDNNL